MAWVRVDDGFYDSEKWGGAPADSVGLWVAAMAWCNRNDDRADARAGIIPAFKLRSLLDVKNIAKTITDLLTRGALHEVEGGYLIHDYAEYQQNDKVQAIRDKRSAAGKKGAARRWHPDDPSVANGMANANAIANSPDAPYPDPDPVGTHVSTESPPPRHGSPEVANPVDKRAAVLDAYAEMAFAKASNVSKPEPWKKSAKNTGRQHADFERYVTTYPDAPASAIAAWLHGEKQSMQYYECVDLSAPDAAVLPFNREATA